jgi:hypothetical protein
MSANVSRYLPAAGGVPDVNSILQIKGLNQGRQVVGIGIHVITGPGLARAAMAPTIVCDDAEAMLTEKKHLVIPGIGAEWPAVAEDDRLTLAPILVVEIDGLGILSTDGDVGHGVLQGVVG